MLDGAHTPVDVNWLSQLTDETGFTITPDSFTMKVPSALTCYAFPTVSCPRINNQLWFSF
jgi:hypothetical protein